MWPAVSGLSAAGERGPAQFPHRVPAPTSTKARSVLPANFYVGRTEPDRWCAVGRPEQQEPVDTVREVDVPDLATKVTESQREAWASGYHAGLSDSQSGGRTTTNPFHPECDDRTGCEVATSLQALERLREMAPQMPIVVLTALDDGATGVTALRRGAQGYMVKQHADGSAIARAIRCAIRRRHQVRSDLDLPGDVIERLHAIGLAMRTTPRRSTEQPALVGRVTEHLNELQQAVDQIRTITPGAADPDDGPLVW